MTWLTWMSYRPAAWADFSYGISLMADMSQRKAKGRRRLPSSFLSQSEYVFQNPAVTQLESKKIVHVFLSFQTCTIICTNCIKMADIFFPRQRFY